MTVSHILGTKGSNVVTMPPTASIESIAQTLTKHRIGAVVIADAKGKPLGIASERDVVNALARGGASVLDQPVATIMTATSRPATTACVVVQNCNPVTPSATALGNSMFQPDSDRAAPP